MVRHLILPSWNFAVLINTGDGDKAALPPDAVPKGAAVLKDLLAAGIDHGFPHGFDLLGCVHVFSNDAPLEILPVIPFALEDDDRVPVMPERHEMHALAQVEFYLA